MATGEESTTLGGGSLSVAAIATPSDNALAMMPIANLFHDFFNLLVKVLLEFNAIAL